MLRQVLLVALCLGVQAASEAESCVDEDGVTGVCVAVENCKSTLLNDAKKKVPKICSFVGKNPIVCCVDNPTLGSVATTTHNLQGSTTEYEPDVYDYESHDSSNKNTCGPVDPDLTSPKTGQKAWDKCVEYQEKLVYPCEKNRAFIGGYIRTYNCYHNADELIVGGQNASRNEFPHMVLLGYKENNAISWECAGSLISEKFILTAGHCVTHKNLGDVSFASLGVLARSEVNPSNTYKVKKSHRHPQYRQGIYNDIAILELEKEVELNMSIVPACLHVGDQIDDSRAIACGWGLLEDKGRISSDVLQKVIVNKFPNTECEKEYPESRLVANNFDSQTQICYGDRNAAKDTCQGDSGGPLQIKHKKINCMYLIIGVTSGGKGCAWHNKPGLYSKVSHHLSWIESIVWP